ncbi:MAG TPA: dihydrofolate reductase family protein [Candidatus Saccharimonadales bacterium]|nr:dihydrofolate reductase family protein [Candidatus Saccharimonadales bacterium]
MRKIIIITMITLDGVMQAPGGPEEDPSNGFKYGGWTAPFSDDNGSEFFQKNMKPAEYLLGRKTFDIFAGYWPEHEDVWPGINNGTKYVLSNTLEKSDWQNTVFLKSIEEIKDLKNSDGSELHVWGSGKLIQLLLKNDLVNELRLVTYPLTLGQGQKLFDDGTIPAAFKLTDSTVTPSGVIMANYKRSGEVKTGTVGA